MPWMVDEEAPLTASAVAPPALIEWPLIFSVGTSLRRRRVNQLREGMDPSFLSHSSRLQGKSESREVIYAMNAEKGSGPRPIEFLMTTSAPSKKRSDLWD